MGFMASTNHVQLTRIRLSVPNGSYEHITHAGNSTGLWTREQIVQWIERNEYQFYTEVNNRRAYVGVVHGLHGKYIRTHADGVWNDNLLALARAA
jgi:hypothetical protein